MMNHLRLPTARFSAGAAQLAFAGALLAALIFLLFVGRYRWFFQDEWDFLAGRDGGDIRDLLIPHNEHWSTLPILVYRALFRVVGLGSYLPYRGLVLVLHVMAAVLLRVVMRRAGTSPWIATAAASLFAFFGSGSSNLLWAFQIGVNGSLVFGLAHLLLADHAGPVDRRDWVGLLAGLASLLSSGVGPIMVAVVGLATLFRRGWRIALLHTVPFAVLYTMWFSAYRDERTAHGMGYPSYDVGSPSQLGRFVRTGVTAAFDAMGQLSGAGWALGILLAVGLVLAWARLDWTERRKLLSVPAALLVGAFLFFVITGVGRAGNLGSEYARQSRYLYVFAALAVPAVAVAADAVAHRWRVLAPAAILVLLIGIPGNVDALLERRSAERSFHFEYRRLILTLPRVPIAHEVPRSMRPEQRVAKRLTLGWLLEGVASGRIPRPATITPVDAATATLHLALNQQPDAFHAKACRNATTPMPLQLEALRAVGIHGIVRVVYITSEGVRSRPVMFKPNTRVVTEEGRALPAPRLVALTGPLALEVDSAKPGVPVTLCV